jgi:hypothetical protein
MRFHARLLLGLCGLALVVPAAVSAAPGGDDEPAPWAPGAQPPAQQAPPHHHKGLFGRRHCVECQRAYAKSHDGVDIPAPPPIGPAGGMPGRVVGNQPGTCDVCQGGAVVSGPIMTADGHAPGYAVVGGMASVDSPGYAVVGEGAPGVDPAPIGVYRNGRAQPGDPRMAAARPGGAGAGAYDPSVVPTNLPPAQVALASPGHDRPHVISHLLGLPIRGHARREREEEARQKHASIAYDQPNQPVTELPSSLVYGKNK